MIDAHLIDEPTAQVTKTDPPLPRPTAGLTPTLLAMVPYAGFSFYCFERLKHLLLGNFAPYCSKPGSDQKVLNVQSKLLCGGFAGRCNLSKKIGFSRAIRSATTGQPSRC